MAGTLRTASPEKGNGNQRVLGGKTKAFERLGLLWVGEQSLEGLQRSIWIATANAENILNHLLFLGYSQKILFLLHLFFFQGDLKLALALPVCRMEEVFHDLY